MMGDIPVNPRPRRGFMLAGRSRPFGDSSYPLLLMMVVDGPVSDYIERHSGVTIAALAHRAGWSVGRTRGVVQSGLAAAYPTIEAGELLILPFRHTAQGYRLTNYGRSVCHVLTNRGTGISLLGELHLTYGEA